MWGFSFCLLYFALAIVIIEANDRDIIKNIKKLKEYAVLTQSVDFTEITKDYTEFESKLSKREKVLKTEPGQLQAVVDPTNVEFNRDFDRDYTNMFLRADKILYEYSAWRLALIRQKFDLAKNKITSSCDIIKFPLTTTFDKYKIITKPGFISNDVGGADDMNDLMRGLVKGQNNAINAAKSGDWTEFASDVYKNIQTLFDYKGNSKNATASKMDFYLLSFLEIESQHSSLQAEADLLYQRSIAYTDRGILDVTQDTLTTRILPLSTITEIFRAINVKYFPEKVAFYPQDAYKSTIGIYRWSSETTLKITYYIKLVPGATNVEHLAWSSALSQVVEEIEENELNIDNIQEDFRNTEVFIDQGKDLVKDLSRLKNVLEDLTDSGLNTTLSEAAQYLIMLLELVGTIGGGFYAYFRWNPKPKTQTAHELEEVVVHTTAIPQSNVLQQQPQQQQQHQRLSQPPRGPVSQSYRLRGVSEAHEPQI